MAARGEFFGPARSISINYDESVNHSPSQATAEIGDVIKISLIGAEDIKEEVRNTFGRESSGTELQGKIVGIWTVRPRLQKGRRSVQYSR